MKRLFREDIQIENKSIKMCSTLLAIKEMPVKTTLPHHLPELLT